MSALICGFARTEHLVLFRHPKLIESIIVNTVDSSIFQGKIRSFNLVCVIGMLSAPSTLILVECELNT